MPSSRPDTVPLVIHLVRQLEPQSILDVGIGFGKWGHLFREYTDILGSENEPARYQRQNWRVRIDGIEGYAAYVTDMHRFIYNHIWIGDACELIATVPNYDLIFLGDIIEHLEKEKGLALLRQAIAKAGQAVILSTPRYDTGQPGLCGNELERHRSLWTAEDLRQFPGALVKTVARGILLAVILKPGVRRPVFAAPPPPDPKEARQWQAAREELNRLIPKETPFILVDEEQLREDLPHLNAFPFPETEGDYGGPPPDDQTAIAECERLRRAGARYLAFISSTFWWLEFYGEFERYLRSNFRCLEESDCVIIFDLLIADS